MKLQPGLSVGRWAEEAWLPAAVLVRSLTLELVGREHGEDSFFRAEVLPLYAWVGLQVICQN